MQMMPVLDEDPATAEEALVRLFMQAGRKLRTRHPEDQVDPSSFALVRALMCGDGLRLSDLAARVELDASTVSRQIRQLEDKAIVERTTDPADGRASLVRLTPYGIEHMQAAFHRRLERIKAVLEPWDEHDKAQLKTLLIRLARDLRAVNDLDEVRSTTS